MSSQDIKATIEQLTASGKAYVIATVVRTEAPCSAKAGDRAVLDVDGSRVFWVGGGGATPAVTRVGLFTLANNHRALGLYESLGFEREGLRRRLVRLPDGTYVDDVMMALFL